MKSFSTLLIFMMGILSLGNAQRPTLDENGYVIERESKSPEDWNDLSSEGYRVANRLVKPILNGDDIDSTLLKMMKERNWKEVLLVTDWTGSMYDYAPQILRWHLTDRSRARIKHLVLFNDGDYKSTEEKKIGITGGIYFVHNPSNEGELLNVIAEVVDNGHGGDGPENDLEAIIRSIKRYDLNKVKDGVPIGFSKLILIADGSSDVRDMELLPQINYPVQIIICHNTKYLNDYLEIAWQTKGSIIFGSEFIDFSNQPKKVSVDEKGYKREKNKWIRDYTKKS